MKFSCLKICDPGSPPQTIFPFTELNGRKCTLTYAHSDARIAILQSTTTFVFSLIVLSENAAINKYLEKDKTKTWGIDTKIGLVQAHIKRLCDASPEENECLAKATFIPMNAEFDLSEIERAQEVFDDLG